MLNPSSPEALSISNTFIITLLIAAVIFLLITGLVIYIAIHNRARPGEPDPPPNFGHTPLEIGWTAGPLVIVTFLAILSVTTAGTALPQSPAGTQPDIIVIGHQWWWEIKYPASGVTTANELHLPAGKSSYIELQSADVIHSLWIPDLGPKLDLNPGEKNYLTYSPAKAATYMGACAEYCGAEHAWMLMKAIVQTQGDFNTWLSQQSKLQAKPTSGAAAQGWQVFSQRTCISCHAINGTGANANVGPNLTHFGSRTTIGAGVLTNTPSNLDKWLANPQAIKPGIYMPNVQLNDQELRALTAYLESLK